MTFGLWVPCGLCGVVWPATRRGHVFTNWEDRYYPPEDCKEPGVKCSLIPFLTCYLSGNLWTSQVAQMVKNLPAVKETWVQSLGQEDPLKKEMATHSSVLAWRIPWTEEPGGLHSPWGRKGLDMTELLTFLLSPVSYLLVISTQSPLGWHGNFWGHSIHSLWKLPFYVFNRTTKIQDRTKPCM